MTLAITVVEAHVGFVSIGVPSSSLPSWTSLLPSRTTYVIRVYANK